MKNNPKLEIIQREIQIVERENVRIFKETRTVLNPENRRLSEPKIRIVDNKPKRLSSRHSCAKTRSDKEKSRRSGGNRKRLSNRRSGSKDRFGNEKSRRSRGNRKRLSRRHSNVDKKH